MESDSADDHSCDHRPDVAALLRDAAHRDVRRDQFNRTGLRTVSGAAPRRARRIAGRRGGAGRARRPVGALSCGEADLRCGAAQPPRTPPVSGFVRRGAATGALVAKQILEWRQNDGWAAPQPAYVLPPFPGLWQPTPPNHPTAFLTHAGSVMPFALLTPDAVPAAAATHADQREVRRTTSTREAHRQIRQRRAHARADRDRAAYGPASAPTASARPQGCSPSGTTSTATSSASAGCRWSTRHVSSCSSTSPCTTAFRAARPRKYVYGLWRAGHRDPPRG